MPAMIEINNIEQEQARNEYADHLLCETSQQCEKEKQELIKLALVILTVLVLLGLTVVFSSGHPDNLSEMGLDAKKLADIPAQIQDFS